MKQIKDAIKNNAILLTSIDLIGVILYLMLMKKFVMLILILLYTIFLLYG